MQISLNGDVKTNRGFSSGPARKWKPDYDTRSEDSCATATSEQKGHYGVLREESSASANQWTHAQYDANTLRANTLKAIESAHAVNMGGFGESSTDMTLPRNIAKRHSGNNNSNNNEPMTQETKFIMDPDEGINVVSDGKISVDVESRVGHSTPVKSRHNHTSPASPRNSTGYRAYDNNVISVDDEKPILYKSVSSAVSESPPPDKNWQDGVLSELQSQSKKGNKLIASDDLITNDNAYLFAYDNKALAASDISLASSKKSVIEPPPEFRDLADAPPAVAVVRPSVNDLKNQFEQGRGQAGNNKQRTRPVSEMRDAGKMNNTSSASRPLTVSGTNVNSIMSPNNVKIQLQFSPPSQNGTVNQNGGPGSHLHQSYSPSNPQRSPSPPHSALYMNGGLSHDRGSQSLPRKPKATSPNRKTGSQKSSHVHQNGVHSPKSNGNIYISEPEYVSPNKSQLTANGMPKSNSYLWAKAMAGNGKKPSVEVTPRMKEEPRSSSFLYSEK